MAGWLKDALKPHDGAARDWLLVDLRSLRSHLPPDMSPQWRQNVQAYDLVAITPDLTPSTLLGAR